MTLFRPLAQTDALRPRDALPLAGGWAWFTHAEALTVAGSEGIVPAQEIPGSVLDRLASPRPAFGAVPLDAPRLMGVVNVTPDSFSDGGLFASAEAALEQAQALAAAGADILDIGGESTRPGSDTVPGDEEIRRVVPVISAIRWAGVAMPVSVDTRKASVARAALDAGADAVNDVSALTFDPALGPLVAGAGVPLVLMHAQGDPKTMQDDPRYDNVLAEVYHWLEARIDAAVAAGVARERIVVDPGIGFGKTVEHNLTLLRGLSLFHGLGCPILLGASRKRFIGSVGRAPDPLRRAPGTISATLAALGQGVQIHRVHDIAEVKQALLLWQAIRNGASR